MPTKVSAAQLSELLGESAQTMRKTAAERDFYKEKYAEMELRTRCEKLARAMHGKGINVDHTIEELTEWHVKRASAGKVSLEVVEQAVELQGPDMAQKIGHLASDGLASGGLSQFEQYLNQHIGSVG
jgi:thiamine pyrophosphate-dependent acetolactate synthase large subunit-like protein